MQKTPCIGFSILDQKGLDIFGKVLENQIQR
jgi:hypothetical protein